jgi:hypothetical protein
MYSLNMDSPFPNSHDVYQLAKFLASDTVILISGFVIKHRCSFHRNSCCLAAHSYSDTW